MLLRIQPDEPLRSFVERNFFLQRHTHAVEIFGAPEFRYRLYVHSSISLEGKRAA